MSQKRLTVREAMTRASEMGKKSGRPECYYWSSVWWRLHAKGSKNPGEAIGYSRAQLALCRDMQKRTWHYTDPRRPAGVSDWQWSGLGAND